MLAALDAVEEMATAVMLRARSYDLLELGDGDRVLDAGCGAGRAVSELAERGHDTIGVDVDEEMVALARSRFPVREFTVASAEELPWPDGTFKGYRADKLLHVFADPARALTEARRVLAPGGRIVLTGQDWDLIAIDAAHIAVSRAILHARADTIASPWAARRYRHSLLDAGFTDVRVEAHTGVITDHSALGPILPGFAEAAVDAEAITRAEADAWLADQERRGRDDRFLVVWPMFVASATAPQAS